jgi:HPt (histidine-containing phosphotransfer) domain-containing protein
MPQPNSSSSPDDDVQQHILDPLAIQRLRATLGTSAEALMPQLVDMFLTDAVTLQTNARQAIEQNKPDELRRAAHSLKSNSANFGAQKMFELALELERRAKNGTLEGATDLLKRIGEEFERTQAAIEKLRTAK